MTEVQVAHGRCSGGTHECNLPGGENKVRGVSLEVPATGRAEGGEWSSDLSYTGPAPSLPPYTLLFIPPSRLVPAPSGSKQELCRNLSSD